MSISNLSQKIRTVTENLKEPQKYIKQSKRKKVIRNIFREINKNLLITQPTPMTVFELFHNACDKKMAQ